MPNQTKRALLYATTFVLFALSFSSAYAAQHVITSIDGDTTDALNQALEQSLNQALQALASETRYL